MFRRVSRDVLSTEKSAGRGTIQVHREHTPTEYVRTEQGVVLAAILLSREASKSVKS